VTNSNMNEFQSKISDKDQNKKSCIFIRIKNKLFFA
jgi:hypothetical protein